MPLEISQKYRKYNTWVAITLTKLDRQRKLGKLKTVQCEVLMFNGSAHQYSGEINEKGELHGKGEIYKHSGETLYKGTFWCGKPDGLGKF